MRHVADAMELAAQQLGCLTQQQILTVMSGRQMQRLVTGGVLLRMLPHVYRFASAPPSWKQDVMAATLWKAGAVLSYRSAARIWNIGNIASQRIAVTVPHAVNVMRTVQGIHVHRSAQLTAYITRKDNIPVTSPARTIVDLSSCLTPTALAWALDDACNRDIVKLDEIRQCLDDMVTKGRPRVTGLRELLATRSSVDERLDSQLERRILTWLRESRLPEPESQQWLIMNGSTYRADLLYRREKIDIEPDGPHHLLPSAAEHDRLRDADFTIEGWIVIRVGASASRESFLARVRTALQRRVDC